MEKPYPIVGIGGMNGSGKDTLGLALEDELGFKFISVSDVLRTEAGKRKEEPTREVLRTISAEWRRERGLGVLVMEAAEVYEELPDEYKGLAIASLRNPGEVDAVHELGGVVVWVDGDPAVRFERIRSTSRNRGFEDKVNFEDFLVEERIEMENTDTNKLSLSGVKAGADLFVENSGSDIDDFKKTTVNTIREAIDVRP